MRPRMIDQFMQALYEDAKSRARVNKFFSEGFDVQVGVHQVSVLSPMLFIIVLETLSCELSVGCPWEMLYADDLVIIAKSLEELLPKMKT